MRRRRAPKRDIKTDPKYASEVVGQFINIIMKDGKKSTAQCIVYGALDIIAEKTKEDPMKVFFSALENVRPRMAVKPRRIGGATYQVPLEVTKEKGIATVLRWFKVFSLKKKGRPMKSKIAEEILAAYKNEGGIIKKREDTHKMAEANRAFAHFKY
jgi:small subunit ribosomal protein S7